MPTRRNCQQKGQDFAMEYGKIFRLFLCFNAMTCAVNVCTRIASS